MFSIGFSEHILPKGSWLLEIGVGVLVLISTCLSMEIELRPCVLWILLRSISGVWLVVGGTSVVAVDSCGTISNVTSNSSSVRAVNWDLFVVLSESVSVGIWVREESSLEHLISRWLNTWDQVAWGESGLLSFSVIVLWVSIQSHFTNFLKWVILMWPDLGDVKNIKSVVISILLWHHLNIPGPGWEVALLDFMVEIGG